MSKPKRKLSARQLLTDINAGMTNQQLAAKRHLTPEQAERVLLKLVDAGLLQRGVHDTERAPATYERNRETADPISR